MELRIIRPGEFILAVSLPPLPPTLLTITPSPNLSILTFVIDLQSIINSDEICNLFEFKY